MPILLEHHGCVKKRPERLAVALSVLVLVAMVALPAVPFVKPVSLACGEHGVAVYGLYGGACGIGFPAYPSHVWAVGVRPLAWEVWIW